MNKTENKLKILKILCLCFFAGAFIYGLVLPFCWGNNPFDTYGTLSLLCEHRKPFFWLWAVLTSGCYFFNAEYMYYKFDSKRRFLDVLALLSVAGMILTAATLDHSILTLNPKRIAHWTGAILFAVFSGASILLFFLINIKKKKGFVLLSVIGASILIVLLLWLLVIGRDGMMEVVPNALFELLLVTVNFTPIFKNIDR